ncbi:ATP-binding protein [Kitasatospora sp. RB6PN24]|uniref:ATP-binding protein n=1 Tax=Kitasatospora humi TaxID=2893891 RepID=UPI001E3B6748|nr:ATP-binding protein [Kitasatospora humi]MCC9309866.1 ATP-binding protein [Kitasatospora humi]
MHENPAPAPQFTAPEVCWFPRSKRTPGLARRLLRDYLARTPGGERFLEVGELLVSELVTNAWQHGTPPGNLIRVGVELVNDELLIAVDDARADVKPELKPLTEDHKSWRGLHLVNELARAWGHGPRDGIGKRAWCVVGPAPTDSEEPLIPRPVLVEIEGVAPPATFARLSDALTATWQSIRRLPLGEMQSDWFAHRLTCPDAVPRVTEALDRHGEVVLPFALAGDRHVLRIRPALGA